MGYHPAVNQLTSIPKNKEVRPKAYYYITLIQNTKPESEDSKHLQQYSSKPQTHLFFMNDIPIISIINTNQLRQYHLNQTLSLYPNSRYESLLQNPTHQIFTSPE
uniref:Uncharacterized protein n=1 Tax=Trichobilharzia regenti TaxID=157069 RepID=A0AA85JV32_TRIRE|nr:unnamed protein product [Trichobilharzia regenti]